MNKKTNLKPVFLVILLDLIGFGIIIPLLPLYSLSLNATKFEIGLLMSMYSIAQFIFAPIWGSLSDHYGRKKILIITLVGSFISTLATAFANEVILLFVARFFAGMMAGNISVATALVSDLTEKQDLSLIHI